MAKGNKHSPALFEVVHGKKHFDKTAREGALRTPSWWFKGRKRMADVGALAPAGAGTALEDPPPFEESEIPPSAADPTQNPSFLAGRELERTPSYEPKADHGGPAAADPTAGPSALMAAARTRRNSPFEFVVDRERQELFLRVRYTTAAVAGASLVMLVALAYIAGRHVGRGPSSAVASASAEQIAAGPISKGVLDLTPRGGSGPGGATSGPAFSSSAGTAAQRQAAPRGAQPAGPPPASPASFSTARPQAQPNDPRTAPPVAAAANGKRVNGWQYILVQSYPDRKTAEDARDCLVQNGIPCTVEKPPKGWPQTWFSVITLTGFERASGPAYQNHKAGVDKVNDRFAGKGSFRRFEPMAIQWRDRAD